MSVTLVNPYCLVDDVLIYLGMLDTVTTDTTLLTRYSDRIADAINDASRYIDNKTAKKFYKVIHTNEIVGDAYSGPECFRVYPSVFQVAQGYIKTPIAPVIEISSIVESGITVVEGMNSENFVVDYVNGMITKNGGNWTPELGKITISAVLGYDNGTDPYDSAIPSPDIPRIIRRYAIIIASIFAGLAKKQVTDGSGKAITVNWTEVPAYIEKDLARIKQRRVI